MGKTPGVGDLAPSFRLPSTAGEIDLGQRLAQGPVLLVFYPGDDTPVCTKQLCDYRENLAVFSDLGVAVLAVNPQSLESHRKFAAKHRLPFPLIADADAAVCRAYGALGLFGWARRVLVLIGRDGRIRYRRSDLPIFRRSAEELREVLSSIEP